MTRSNTSALKAESCVLCLTTENLAFSASQRCQSTLRLLGKWHGLVGVRPDHTLAPVAPGFGGLGRSALQLGRVGTR